MTGPDTPIDQADQRYYDKDYFDTGSKRMTDAVTGKEIVWGYKGTDWSGHYFIVDGLLQVFDGELGSVIDLGCGQGSFVDYALRAGLVSKGYDFSEYAISTAKNLAVGNVFQADLLEGVKELDQSWDLVYCSDVLEHLPKTKERAVIKELYRVSRRWVFLQFPVAQKESEIFDAEVHDKNHPLYAHFKIAGHLNMELRSWWDPLFLGAGFKIREDLVTKFREVVPKPVWANWANIVILEK